MKKVLLAGALLVLLCSLVLVVTGASITQSRTSNGGVEILSPLNHQLLGEATGALAIALGLAASFSKTNLSKSSGRYPMQAIAWLPAAAAFADVIAGTRAPGQSHVAGFFHGLLAQLLVASAAALVMAWLLPSAPVPVHDIGWPSLRGYAVLTLALVIAQIMLGAAYRHELMGVMAHIIGALMLVLSLLGLAMLVLNLQPESTPLGNPLRVAAIFLLVFAGIQLTLGMTAVSLPVTSAALAPVTIAHATVASLTLSSTAVLTILVLYHARRAK